MSRLQTPDIMGDLLDAKTATELIPLDRIRADGGTQMRAALNEDTVREYEEKFLGQHAWGDFPPVILFYDGTDYWIGDGFHRIEAYRRACGHPPTTPVHADVRAGSRRDAILFAAGANASHGLRRTQADKRRSVETLLRDEEWQKWSDREIARICHVSADLVGDVRKATTPPVTVDSDSETVRTYTNRHGGTSTMRVDNIGSNQPSYASIWDLQRRVDEFARANGWQAPALRRAGRNQRNDENYVLLEAAITVEHRRADLVQAIHNVANQWEDREEQQRKAREGQMVQLPADIAGSGYQIHWKAADGWRVLAPDGSHVQTTGLNSLSECANLIRRLVPSVVPAGRPMMEVLRTEEELAADAEAADIASREAAADEAAREAAAETDPWAVAVNSSGSRQHRAELLAVALQPWIREYKDEYGRTWRDLALHGNPSHSNSTFWRDITAEAKRRSIHIHIYDDIWKFAIKQAFSWLLANEPSETDDSATVTPDAAERSQAEPAAAALADLPIVATTDPRLCYQVAGSNLRSAMQALAAAAAAIKGKDDYVSNNIDRISRDIQFVLKVCA